MPRTPIRGLPLHSMLQEGELVRSLVTLRWEEVLFYELFLATWCLIKSRVFFSECWESIPSRMESSGSASLTFSGNVKLARFVEVD